MANRQIGETLKKYRKLRGWTVSDVVVQLREQYQMEVAEKTVYGWESDQAMPRTETLLTLCELYHINHLSDGFIASPTTENDFAITPDEMELIKQYRKHPELHEVIHRVLDSP